MTEKYAASNPLSLIVEHLEKFNEDRLAEQVIDVFARTADSGNLEQLNLLAKLYLDIRANDKAIEYAERVLSLAKDPASMYNCRANLAKLYNNINEPEKSLFYSQINHSIDAGDVDTQLEMVFALYLMNKKADAERILRALKIAEANLTEAQRDIVNFNLGTYDLEQGKFIEGMKGFMLKGEKLKIWFSPRKLPYKFWDGGIFPGKTLILFAEGGGLGDEMLSVRFMDDIKKLGMRPLYYTSRKDMYELFNRCGYETVMDLDTVPHDSLWTYFMQTPIWLNSTPKSVKRSDAYLYASDSAKAKFEFMKQSPKLKIGIRWQGNAKNERDLHRKVELATIMDMLLDLYRDRDDVEFYSLQIGDGIDAAKDYPQLIDITDKIKSYDDTFAFLANLDYVVTSCTSVLHASAIAGTKTLGLIPIQAYFTWVSPSPGRTSIWYGDNLQLFRQQTSKQWDEPIAEMREYIEKEIHGTN
jgi:hypothetical protein